MNCLGNWRWRKGRRVAERNMEDWAKRRASISWMPSIYQELYNIHLFGPQISSTRWISLYFYRHFRNGKLRYQWSIFRWSSNSKQVWTMMIILHHPEQRRTWSISINEKARRTGRRCKFGRGCKDDSAGSSTLNFGILQLWMTAHMRKCSWLENSLREVGRTQGIWRKVWDHVYLWQADS